jgi:hypothetical protein
LVASPVAHTLPARLHYPVLAQDKFRHFEASDAARFRELWALQQEEAAGLARRLLDASRVISEQQLGWGWQAPDEKVRLGPNQYDSTQSAGLTMPGNKLP